jgi:hypothetical protein
MSDVPGKNNPRPFIANSGVTNLAKVAKPLGVASVAFSGYELAEAASEGRFVEQAQIEVGRTSGAWAGMKLTAGAVAYSPIPITKHPVVAVVLVGVGGIAGSIGGDRFVNWLQGSPNQSLNTNEK